MATSLTMHSKQWLLQSLKWDANTLEMFNPIYVQKLKGDANVGELRRDAQSQHECLVRCLYIRPRHLLYLTLHVDDGHV